MMNKTCPICIFDLDETNEIVMICCDQSVCKKCMRQYILINKTISCILCHSNEIDSLIQQEKILTKKEFDGVMKSYTLGYERSIDQLLEKYKTITKLVREVIAPFVVRVVANSHDIDLVMKEIRKLPNEYLKNPLDWSYFETSNSLNLESLITTVCYIIGKSESIFLGDESFLQELLRVTYEDQIIQGKAKEILQKIVTSESELETKLSAVEDIFSYDGEQELFVKEPMPSTDFRACLTALLDSSDIFYKRKILRDYYSRLAAFINKISFETTVENSKSTESNTFKQLFLCRKCNDTELEYNIDKTFCHKCNNYMCGYCGDFFHTTNCDSNLRNVLEKEVFVRCPRCTISISKVMGCNDMFCVQCHAKFDYRTGKFHTGRHFHNIHYTEYLRSQGGRPIDNQFAEWKNNLSFHNDNLKKNCRPITREEYQFIDILFSNMVSGGISLLKKAKVSELKSRHLKDVYYLILSQSGYVVDVHRTELQQVNDIALELREMDNILTQINWYELENSRKNDHRYLTSTMTSFDQIIVSNDHEIHELKNKIIKSMRRSRVSSKVKYQIAKNMANFDKLMENLSASIFLRNRFHLVMLNTIHSQVLSLDKRRNQEDLLLKELRDLYKAYMNQYEKIMPKHIRKLSKIADKNSLFDKMIGRFIY